MHRPLALLVPTVAAGLALAGCGDASTADQAQPRASAGATATVLHLTAKATGGSGVDNAPKGPSLGDVFLEHGTVTGSSGAKAGSYQLVTQLVAGTPRRGDEHVSLTLHLADGDVIALDDIPARDSYTLPVIGGTRAYARSVGTLAAQAVAGGTEDLTLTLER